MFPTKQKWDTVRKKIEFPAGIKQNLITFLGYCLSETSQAPDLIPSFYPIGSRGTEVSLKESHLEVRGLSSFRLTRSKGAFSVMLIVVRKRIKQPEFKSCLGFTDSFCLMSDQPSSKVSLSKNISDNILPINGGIWGVHIFLEGISPKVNILAR